MATRTKGAILLKPALWVLLAVGLLVRGPPTRKTYVSTLAGSPSWARPHRYPRRAIVARTRLYRGSTGQYSHRHHLHQQ